MRKLRTAVTGCGKVGHLHAAALAELPESLLVAHCDPHADRAGLFAQRYGGQAYTDLERMLQEAQVEALCICTPPPLHRPAVSAAAAQGVHVLVEKPFAACVEDCDAMLAAAAHAGITLSVVSQRRWLEPVRRMKDAIVAGKIGSPALGTVLMLSWRDAAYYASDPWRGRWDTEGGGVLVNQAPHHLDILLWCMGQVAEVSGDWANLSHPFVEVEDTALATVRFQQGGLGSIAVSLCQNPGLYTKIHVHGANGASVGVQTDTGATFVAGMSEVVEPPFTDVWTIPGEQHLLAAFQQEDRQRFTQIDATRHYHALQIQDFLQAAAAGREPAVTGADGRAVVQLFQAIYQAGRERRTVKVA